MQRLKRARRFYWNYYSRANTSARDGLPVREQSEMDGRRLGILIATPQLCSCSGCGNPRRHAWFKGERLTVQERRGLVQYKEQVEEVIASLID